MMTTQGSYHGNSSQNFFRSLRALFLKQSLNLTLEVKNCFRKMRQFHIFRFLRGNLLTFSSIRHGTMPMNSNFSP